MTEPREVLAAHCGTCGADLSNYPVNATGHICGGGITAPDEPTTDEQRSYNRGWGDGNASALDACDPIIADLQSRLAASVLRLTDAEWNEAYRAGRAAGITEMVDAQQASAPSLDEGLLARAFQSWMGDDGKYSRPQARYVAAEYRRLAQEGETST